MSKRGNKETWTRYRHEAEAALHATHAATGATQRLLEVLLDEQKAPDEPARRQRVHEVIKLLKDAQRWAEISLEPPESGDQIQMGG